MSDRPDAGEKDPHSARRFCGASRTTENLGLRKKKIHKLFCMSALLIHDSPFPIPSLSLGPNSVRRDFIWMNTSPFFFFATMREILKISMQAEMVVSAVVPACQLDSSTTCADERTQGSRAESGPPP